MKKGLLFGLVILILTGCGGKKNNPAPAPVTPPAQAVQVAPAVNSVCTTGTILSATQSSISFSWNASTNTDSYDLTITNLLTAVATTQNTTLTQLTVTLLRNTPYSWSVTSKSTKTTATMQSAVWKFYNAGPGIVTYAPFPADITAPTFGQAVTATAGKINLTWTGSTVSPDVIAGYDVYFGTTNSPAILQSAITASFVNGVSVTSGTTYYWKVISKDANGNTSDSGLYQFSVN